MLSLVGMLAWSAPTRAFACSNAGLDGLYLWPMEVRDGARSCRVSVQLLFDGQGHGWMQPVDGSCPRPGAGADKGGPFRYQVGDECSGSFTDGHGRYQLELEREDVELTWEQGGRRVGGVATRQRELMPGERALIGERRQRPARPSREAAR